MITSSKKNSFAIYYDGCLVNYAREDKAGYIEQHHSPILARIGLDSEQCCLLILLVDLAVIEYFITFGA